jgi:L-methionine (R)-S-oxide reductase
LCTSLSLSGGSAGERAFCIVGPVSPGDTLHGSDVAAHHGHRPFGAPAEMSFRYNLATPVARSSIVNKSERYAKAYDEILAVLSDEGDERLDSIAVMATINALLVANLEGFFWTGFYRVCGDQLVVGPYIGTLGCLMIPIGKGVCGTAAAKRETVIVPDVNAFPGHIACDARTRSEIVVPLFGPARELIGVLDIDSDRLASFDDTDREWLEKICAIFQY